MGMALDRIRAATAELHGELDRKSYAKALLDGSLPISHYGAFLRALWLLHSELERTVERSSNSSLRHVYDLQFFQRRSLLENDLAHLKLDLEQADGASLQALVLAQQVRLAALSQPASLFGVAYVLEGSQLGGRVQRQALSSRPELAEGGLGYLAGAGQETRRRFLDFAARWEAALIDEAELEQAIEAAKRTFEGFARILDALAPEHVDGPWLAGELNPEAGMHAVPDRLREVRAALAAGELSYHEVAYYRARYGERGLRYTRSDSAWLATLSRERDRNHALQHVHWLGRVLAARGMPRILLERHLVRLHEALVASSPAQASGYDCLRDASSQLRQERYAALPAFDELSESFTQGLGNEATISPHEAASLLLGAVADERRGVAQAVASLRTWLCDPARFSPAWIRALDELLQRARAGP